MPRDLRFHLLSTCPFSSEGGGNLVKDHRGDVAEHINGQTLRGDLGGGNLFRREGAERMLDGVKADFSG